mmetsp:Transcript_8263/g.18867  ORF Transcript_8263/g.18867 Transcript_8263/m.18867 type:complete len:304 (-) Transcript_8263:120-1031(-)
MSYSTYDKHGGISTHYAHGRGGGPGAGTGRTWWPDFGPATRDFSAQDRSHPTETIFERVVKPGKWSATKSPGTSPASPVAAAFRNPQPARDALLTKAEPTPEAKRAAKAVTERQAALRRLEMRQRRVDSYLGAAPVHMTATTLSEARHARSESCLRDVNSSQASEVSRDVYERHGYLVGRSKGSIADGSSGAHSRKHNPLSYTAMLFGGKVVGDSSSRSKKGFVPRRPSKQWKTCPESSFIFDRELSLPVPRGGWNLQRATKWPDPENAGNREYIATGLDSIGAGRSSAPALPSTSADSASPS